MRQFTKMHFIENAVWVSLVILLFAFSFEFDKEIEIYKFGAAGWPTGGTKFVNLNFFVEFKRKREQQYHERYPNRILNKMHFRKLSHLHFSWELPCGLTAGQYRV